MIRHKYIIFHNFSKIKIKLWLNEMRIQAQYELRNGTNLYNKLLTLVSINWHDCGRSAIHMIVTFLSPPPASHFLPVSCPPLSLPFSSQFLISPTKKRLGLVLLEESITFVPPEEVV